MRAGREATIARLLSRPGFSFVATVFAVSLLLLLLLGPGLERLTAQPNAPECLDQSITRSTPATNLSVGSATGVSDPSLVVHGTYPDPGGNPCEQEEGWPFPAAMGISFTHRPSWSETDQSFAGMAMLEEATGGMEPGFYSFQATTTGGTRCFGWIDLSYMDAVILRIEGRVTLTPSQWDVVTCNPPENAE